MIFTYDSNGWVSGWEGREADLSHIAGQFEIPPSYTQLINDVQANPEKYIVGPGLNGLYYVELVHGKGPKDVPQLVFEFQRDLPATMLLRRKIAEGERLTPGDLELAVRLLMRRYFRL